MNQMVRFLIKIWDVGITYNVEYSVDKVAHIEALEPKFHPWKSQEQWHTSNSRTKDRQGRWTTAAHQRPLQPGDKIVSVLSRDQLWGTQSQPLTDLHTQTTPSYTHTTLKYNLSMYRYLYFHYLCENGFDKILAENQNCVLQSTLKL